MKTQKLTDHDCWLIAELKAERSEYRRKASSLKDSDIAKKFGVSPRTVERIPEAPRP